MILRERDTAHDPRTAALDVFAAARFLAAAGIELPRLWLASNEADRDPRRTAVIHAWSRGIAVVPIAGRDTRNAAMVTATAVGARVVEPAQLAGDDPGGPLEGERAAARFALGIDPDESVELVLGETAVEAIEDRLATFDARLEADGAVRHRLILADLAAHGARLSPPLVAAIVHPLVLVELRRPDARLIALARTAADEVVAPS